MDVLSRNHVTVHGRGERTVVLAHGFGTDQRMWHDVAPALGDEFRVVLFDHVGSGRSDPGAYSEERYGDLDGYAGDVLEIMAALDLEGAAFVGHSIGAMIGVRAAIAEPARFSCLVSMGGLARYLNAPPDYVGGFSREDVDGLLDLMESNYLTWAHTLAPGAMKNPERPELSRLLEASFNDTDRVLARRFAAVTFLSDSRALLPRVPVPTLVMQCTDDMIVPPPAAAYLHRNLPRSTMRLLGATGHYPQLSAPDEVIGTLRAYLRDPLTH